jgi:predicted lipid-binding transport protein (Tim44 family)
MQKVWDAGVWVLRAGFELADQVSWIDPSTITGKTEQRPNSPNPATAVDAATAGADGQSLSLWSSLIGLATLIALGLFFYQLISVALRGGRGMFRAFTGPLQFGMAIALTSGHGRGPARRRGRADHVLPVPARRRRHLRRNPGQRHRHRPDRGQPRPR